MSVLAFCLNIVLASTFDLPCLALFVAYCSVPVDITLFTSNYEDIRFTPFDFSVDIQLFIK
jgi:hypothetical protein